MDRMTRARAWMASACVVLGVMTAPAVAGAAEPAGAPCATPHPWCATSMSAEQRTDLLMQAMSETDMENVVSNNAVPALGIPAEVANFTDGPVGAPAGTNSTKSGTGLPSASSLGATFNPAMATLYGTVAGTDARAYGYDGIWGPTLNTLRTPLAGRGEEYIGEDPFLIAQMGISEVKAEQAQGEMVQIKHFVANDQEGQAGVPIVSGTVGGRMFTNVNADERTLREIYMAPFEAVIADADPASVMCSYNRVNGPYACEDPWLLKTVLRTDWHYQGFVAPDFGANHPAAVANDFNAGEQTGYNGPTTLGPLLASGMITAAQLQEDAHDILWSFFEHGVFDRAPYTDDPTQINTTGEQDTAMQIEEQGATLLTNQHNALPLHLPKGATIAVIGSAANGYVRGSGSPEVAPFFHQTLLQGIQARAAAAGDTVVYNDGSNLSSAESLAKSSAVAIVVAADSETEGTDKLGMSLDTPSYGLPDLQSHDPQVSVCQCNEMISGVAGAQPNTVAVLETGEPVLTPFRSQVAALLEAWYPGEGGGTAVAHILWGDVDPSGRLSSTFPVNDTDGPATSPTKDLNEYPGNATNNEYYTEGVLVGYRWYQAKHIPVAFPFGFGLSYTSFSYATPTLRPLAALSGAGAAAAAGGPEGVGGLPVAHVSVVVTNTGSRAGYAVPELYLGLPQPSASVNEPPETLAGFQKVMLAPGQSRRVTFVVNARQLAYWSDSAEAWEIAPGCTDVMVGTSSASVVSAGVLSDGGAHCSATGPAAVKASLRSSQRGALISVTARLPVPASRFIFRFQHGVSFSRTARRSAITKQLAIYGPTRQPLTLTSLSAPHGRVAFRTAKGLERFTFHLAIAHLWLLNSEARALKARGRLTVTGVFEVLGTKGHTYAETIRAVITKAQT